MNAPPSAHSARHALASVRAQNPQLAEKVQLATDQAEQLALFASPAAQPESEISRGLKTHEWDRQNPISKTAFAVVLFCTRCKVRMKLSRGSSPQYRVREKHGDEPAILVWSSVRPVCIPKDTPYGSPTS